MHGDRSVCPPVASPRPSPPWGSERCPRPSPCPANAGCGRGIQKETKSCSRWQKAQQNRTTAPQPLSFCKPNPPFLEKSNSSSSVFLGAGEWEERSAGAGSLGRGSAILQSASISVSATRRSTLEVMAAASAGMPRWTLGPARRDFGGWMCSARRDACQRRTLQF